MRSLVEVLSRLQYFLLQLKKCEHGSPGGAHGDTASLIPALGACGAS